MYFLEETDRIEAIIPLLSLMFSFRRCCSFLSRLRFSVSGIIVQVNELHQVPYYIIRVVLKVIIFTSKFVHHYVLQSTISLEIHKLKKIPELSKILMKFMLCVR